MPELLLLLLPSREAEAAPEGEAEELPSREAEAAPEGEAEELLSSD